MAHGIEIHGFSGELRIGGRCAAKLGNWELRPCEGAARVSAALLEKDDFWLEQDGSFTLVLSWGTRERRWRNITVLATVGNSIAIQTKEWRSDD